MSPAGHNDRPGAPLPVAVVGAGPIGLITALGLIHYGVPVMLFEEDRQLSLDTKAGTVLTRTLEVLDRYDAVGPVLAASLRLDEIGELDRATGESTGSVLTGLLIEDTRYPFVINIPQHELEPVLQQRLEELAPDVLRMQHRLTGFTEHPDRVELSLQTPDGPVTVDASRLLACDGGRSSVRQQLGIAVQGQTLERRYMLIDLTCDLDVGNPRDYPYLAYFGDPAEWMILVRQPHCWRFLFPLAEGAKEPSQDELVDKARRFIGDVDDLQVLGSNIYSVHHRVAERWRHDRTFLMGDAAHLITPMWALGLNTGVLDASNLPWRLAWVHRGWADDTLLDGYEHEQSPVAIQGSGEMAAAAGAVMDRRASTAEGMGSGGWGDALTRTLLGVSLDVDGTGDWSMVRTSPNALPVRVGERAPDLTLFDTTGRVHVHDLVRDSFVALHFTDARRRPTVPAESPPGLQHLIVSRWDAPHDSGLREVALFDPGDRVRRRFGIESDVVVLLRPDAHVAALLPYGPGAGEQAEERYRAIIGRSRVIV